MEIRKFSNYSKTVRILFNENEAEFFCRLTGGKPREPLSILATDSLKVCGRIGGRIVSFSSTWLNGRLDSAYVRIKLHRPFIVARHTDYEMKVAGLPYKVDKCTEVSIFIETTSDDFKQISVALSSKSEIHKMKTRVFNSIPKEVYTLVTGTIKMVTEDTRKAKAEADKLRNK